MTAAVPAQAEIGLTEALDTVLAAAERWAESMSSGPTEPIGSAVAAVRAALRGDGDQAPAVVCVRDPDAPNRYIVLGHSIPAVTVIDVDLGGASLDDPAEFDEWAASQLETVAALPPGHGARQVLLEEIDSQREMYHDDRWSDLDALRRCLGGA